MRPHPRSNRSSERGGVVILVVLSLLVLLTIASTGMSRNSLREMAIVGSSRQAATVRQAADTGLEFAILWSDPRNVASLSGAQAFQATQATLLANPDYQGIFQDLPAQSDTTFTSTDQETKFSLRLLRMGKLPVMRTSVADERLYDDIWVAQSIGNVTPTGTGLTFEHRKELWLTTPAKVN